MNLIKFPNDIKKFYNKIIHFEFSSKENDLIFFRISLLFNGIIENIFFFNIRNEFNML
jgi:hypothetical protein